MTKEEAEATLARYSTRTRVIDNRPRGWNHLEVEILFDGERIGAYRRNYMSLIHTFRPFVQTDGQGGHRILALYSSHYTATRLMRLPECVDIGGEEPSSGGFCPADFLVPFDPRRGLTGQFGFLAGCVWGDDSSWKIQYLDLREAASGVPRSEGRFGYIALPRHIQLRDAVNFEFYNPSDEYGEIELITGRTYFLKSGNRYEIDAETPAMRPPDLKSTYATTFLRKTVSIRIDHPLGSAYQEYGTLYPVNYGCVPGTLAPDGAEVDAYVLGVFKPVKEFTGVCVAVIHRTEDVDDDQLVVVPEDKDYTDDQIRALTEFQESNFTSDILRLRRQSNDDRLDKPQLKEPHS